MAYSLLILSGSTRICVARGIMSWGSEDGAAGELELWYDESRGGKPAKPFPGVQMEQRQFFNYKQHIEGKYTSRHIATGGSTFRDIHWINFRWGLELNPSSNRSVLIHHPNEVWMDIVRGNRGGTKRYGRRELGTFLWSNCTISLSHHRPKSNLSFVGIFDTSC